MKKTIASILCFILVFSICGSAAQAATAGGSTVESGGTYLVPSNAAQTNWNPCAAFSAAKTGVTFTLTTYDPGATDYNVQLYAGELGAGTPVETCFNVPIGSSVTFAGLTVGARYYFGICSDTMATSGATAVYSLAASDAQSGSFSGGGYSVQFYYNNGASVSVNTYINVKGNFTLIGAPTYAGYDFVGWGTDGAVYQPGDVVNVTQNMRFDAQWTASIPARNPFTDVSENDAYFNDVMYVYETGLMTGTSATTFSPNDPVTRAAIWTVLARMNGVDTTGGSNWYEQAREWAVGEGITDGSDPERSISRQEIITMLYRQAGSPTVTNAGNHVSTFGDMNEIASWAYDAVIWAIQNGLLDIYYSGGMLGPTHDAARWELACLFTRYDSNIV